MRRIGLSDVTVEGDRVVEPGTNTSTTTAALVAAADALIASCEQWHDRALAITIRWWKVVASGPGRHSPNGGVPNVNQGNGRAVDRILSLLHHERYKLSAWSSTWPCCTPLA